MSLIFGIPPIKPQLINSSLPEMKSPGRNIFRMIWRSNDRQAVV